MNHILIILSGNSLLDHSQIHRTILNQVGICTLHVSTLGFTSLLESYMMGLYVSRYNDCRKLDLVMIEHTKKKKEEQNQGKQEPQETEIQK